MSCFEYTLKHFTENIYTTTENIATTHNYEMNHKECASFTQFSGLFTDCDVPLLAVEITKGVLQSNY